LYRKLSNRESTKSERQLNLHPQADSVGRFMAVQKR